MQADGWRSACGGALASCRRSPNCSASFSDPSVPALLAHLAARGVVERVDQERYALKQALEEFRRAVEETLRELGAATPAQFRDRLGLTRKYLIPLLEWADRRGITSRKGDTRVLRA